MNDVDEIRRAQERLEAARADKKEGMRLAGTDPGQALRLLCLSVSGALDEASSDVSPGTTRDAVNVACGAMIPLLELVSDRELDVQFRED